MKPSRNSPSVGDAYVKPHLVVENKIIEEADALLVEIDGFVQQANTALVTLFPSLTRIRKWRAKRRDEYLISLYEAIYPKIRDMEKRLRAGLGEIVEKKKALRLQSKYLKVRLEACMAFNSEMLAQTDGPLTELSIVNNLSSASVAVKSMMVFNNELLKQRNLQQVKQGKFFIPWAKRPAAARPVTEAELAADSDHPILNRRLHELRKLRGKFVEHLSEALEVRETYTSNLENCASSRQDLIGVLARDAAKDEVNIVPPPFDHAKCTDCSYARAIASDCVDHIAALHTQAITTSRRLQLLVEARETMRDVAENSEMSDGGNLLEKVNGSGAITALSDRTGSAEFLYADAEDLNSPRVKTGSSQKMSASEPLETEDGDHSDLRQSFSQIMLDDLVGAECQVVTSISLTREIENIVSGKVTFDEEVKPESFLSLGCDNSDGVSNGAGHRRKAGDEVSLSDIQLENNVSTNAIEISSFVSAQSVPDSSSTLTLPSSAVTSPDAFGYHDDTIMEVRAARSHSFVDIDIGSTSPAIKPSRRNSVDSSNVAPAKPKGETNNRNQHLHPHHHHHHHSKKEKEQPV